MGFHKCLTTQEYVCTCCTTIILQQVLEVHPRNFGRGDHLSKCTNMLVFELKKGQLLTRQFTKLNQI
jgi:hypothetical protein